MTDQAIPARAHDRALAPDLARGLMLALIALANVGIYLYGSEYGFRQQIIEHAAPDRITRALTTLLVDGRAYPLFAALFAFGIIHIYSRERARGESDRTAARLLRRRCAWLAGFGVVHAALLFPGDILGTYALLGLFVIALRNASDRALLCWTCGGLVVTTAIGAGVYGDLGPMTSRAHMTSFDIGEPGWALIIRMLDWLTVPFGTIGIVVAAPVGIWLARRQLLTKPGEPLRLLATSGIALGVAGGVPGALVAGGVWDGASLGPFIGALHTATGVFGGVGYLAVIALLAEAIHRRRELAESRVVRAVAACGARSLTCYLAQSVVFVAVFIPYTLGLGAQLTSVWAAAVALGTWLITVITADILARHGKPGPAESLLRRLVYRGYPPVASRVDGRAAKLEE